LLSSKLKKHIANNLFNCLSFHSRRKLLVIESDDWGAIRTPSKEVYLKLLSKGIVSDNDPFAKYDALASEDDLAHFFETLNKFKDRNNRTPVITANCIVANPDFDKINRDSFEKYHYEYCEQTYKRYPKHQSSFDIWREGIKQGLVFPQYHGREHVNVPIWMSKLLKEDSNFKIGLDLGTYAIDQTIVAALNAENQQQQKEINKSIIDGYVAFEKLYGFKSLSFTAPNYIWNDEVEEVLQKIGVKILQGSKRQNIPQFDNERLKYKYHYTGQLNKMRQFYLVRNCLFEPSISPKIDYVSTCLKQIENAFYWKAPAIIGSHRLNYIGYLEENNRLRNIKSLEKLLKIVLQKHPDVEFITSAELGEILLNQKQTNA